MTRQPGRFLWTLWKALRLLVLDQFGPWAMIGSGRGRMHAAGVTNAIRLLRRIHGGKSCLDEAFWIPRSGFQTTYTSQWRPLAKAAIASMVAIYEWKQGPLISG